MRKTILTVATTMIIMGILGGLFISNLIEGYEADINSLKTINVNQTNTIDKLNGEIKHLKNQNDKLNSEITDMEEQVWNMMNDEDYDITIHHDGALHSWKSTKDGLFRNEMHIVTY